MIQPPPTPLWPPRKDFHSLSDLNTQQEVRGKPPKSWKIHQKSYLCYEIPSPALCHQRRDFPSLPDLVTKQGEISKKVRAIPPDIESLCVLKGGFSFQLSVLVTKQEVGEISKSWSHVPIERFIPPYAPPTPLWPHRKHFPSLSDLDTQQGVKGKSLKKWGRPHLMPHPSSEIPTHHPHSFSNECSNI